MNANEAYYHSVIHKTLRYLVAKTLLVKPLSIEDLYEEIDSYDPYEFNFSMKELINNGLDFDLFLKEYFVVENNIVSLSSSQREELYYMEEVIKESSKYNFSRDESSLRMILSLVKKDDLDSTILYILIGRFFFERECKLDTSSLESLGQIYRFICLKNKSIKYIQMLKEVSIKNNDYPIETIKGLTDGFYNFFIDVKEVLNLNKIKDLYKFKNETIYLILYRELDYNLLTLKDFTGDFKSNIDKRIDRFMDRYITSSFYKEYRKLYYKETYPLVVDIETKEAWLNFIKNALYSWLKDKHDYLIYNYIKSVLDALNLKKGTISAIKLFNYLGGGLFAFKIITYIVTTDKYIVYDKYTDCIYYDINSYNIIFNEDNN